MHSETASPVQPLIFDGQRPPLLQLAPAGCVWQTRCMMMITILARGGSFALLALWSWLLFRDHRQFLPARLAIAMNAAIICHVIANVPGLPTIPVVDFLFELGSGMVAVFFWLFARTWFNDKTSIDWKSWALVAASAILLSVMILEYPERSPLFWALALTWRISLFGFALAGLWEAWRGRANDLVEPRRRFRAILVVVVALAVGLTNLVEILANNVVLPEDSRHLLEILIFVLAFGFCAAMFDIKQSGLFGEAVKLPDSRTPVSDDPLANRLLDHMVRERSYRLETLTIAALAAQLGEQEYRIRRVINGQLGHRNFAAFLNGYRLDEVKQALADPDQRDVPILTIALDAGFGSLGPFNRAFREAEGTTPSLYRGKHLAG